MIRNFQSTRIQPTQKLWSIALSSLVMVGGGFATISQTAAIAHLVPRFSKTLPLRP